MSARIVALIFVAGSLAACGTTATTMPSTSMAETASAPSVPTSGGGVVRSPIVPDDDVLPAVASAPEKPAKPSKRIVEADASTSPAPDLPVVAEPPAKPKAEPKPKPEKKSEALNAVPPSSSTGGSGSGGSGTGGSASGDHTLPTPSDTTGVASSSASEATPLSQPVEPAPTASAEPTSAPPVTTPSKWLSIETYKELGNRKVSGFPLWLIAAVGLLLLVGLLFGTTRKRPARRQEPRPAADERRYSEDSDEAAAPA